MKPATARHRIDATAAALTRAAEQMGIGVVPLGGAIDACLHLGSVVRLVDFKSPSGRLTRSQQRLIDHGCPIQFIATLTELEAVIEGMRRDVRLRGR